MKKTKKRKQPRKRKDSNTIMLIIATLQLIIALLDYLKR